MKIVDLKCAVLGNNPVVWIVTDKGFDVVGKMNSTAQSDDQ